MPCSGAGVGDHLGILLSVLLDILSNAICCEILGVTAVFQDAPSINDSSSSGQSVMLVQVRMSYVCSGSTSIIPARSASDGAQQGDSLHCSLNQKLLFLQFKQANMIN